MSRENRLFRMTTKRKILMESIITTMNMRIEHNEGFARMSVAYHPDPAKRMEDLDCELLTLKRNHDVLETVMCHDREWQLSQFLMEARDWKNEWDIPEEVFRRSIEEVISLLDWYKEQGRKEYEAKYDEKIAFLRELLSHRMNLPKGEI